MNAIHWTTDTVTGAPNERFMSVNPSPAPPPVNDTEYVPPVALGKMNSTEPNVTFPLSNGLKYSPKTETQYGPLPIRSGGLKASTKLIPVVTAAARPLGVTSIPKARPSIKTPFSKERITGHVMLLPAAPWLGQFRLIEFLVAIIVLWTWTDPILNASVCVPSAA